MRGPMLGKVEALAGNRKRQRATNDEGRTILEARGGIEPPIEVLQTSALPLGYRASWEKQARNPRPRRGSRYLERETGFEPATSTLARSHSTAELLPLVLSFYSTCSFRGNSLHPQTLPLIGTRLFPAAHG